MSADAKRKYGSTIGLITLGILAMYGGPPWLLLVIPAAALIWYATSKCQFKGTGTDVGWSRKQ
ncbi:MAG: hypothetical protein WA474_02085 [Candidatus Sulfotelmatobacter sp.]